MIKALRIDHRLVHGQVAFTWTHFLAATRIIVIDDKAAADEFQKMALNMISTTLMIQLGRVKGNRMINMQLTNKKLVDRGTRMIIDELGLDYEQANHLLLAHGSVKKAIDAYRHVNG